jgi:hypothetical protein
VGKVDWAATLGALVLAFLRAVGMISAVQFCFSEIAILAIYLGYLKWAK